MKWGDITLTVLCAALLLGFGGALLLLPASEFSETENRALTMWEAPTLRQIADGSFAERLRDVSADQFPLRSRFTALKSWTERCLGKQENNGILFGKNGYLIPRAEIQFPALLNENLRALTRLEEQGAEAGIPVSILLVPRSVDVTSSFYPTAFAPVSLSLPVQKDAWVFPAASLQAAAEAGEEVWYRTDHHWTTYGAYLAYRSLADALGISPYPLESFTPVTVAEDFLGTSYSKAGGIVTAYDRVVLYRYAGDGAVTVYNHETKESSQGFYDFTALSQKDKYEVFLGGNYSRLSISDPSEEKPRMLLVKDSFANALIPFLALHFDLEVIDPRYEQEPLSLSGYDHVLVVQGVDTLSADPSLKHRIP